MLKGIFIVPNIKVTIDVELDGKRISGYPFSRRIEITEQQAFEYLEVTGGGYVSIPSSALATLSTLVLKTDKALTLRLQNQSDAGLVINAGGIIALVDVALTSGASTNATLSNASGSDATIEGIAAA